MPSPSACANTSVIIRVGGVTYYPWVNDCAFYDDVTDCSKTDGMGVQVEYTKMLLHLAGFHQYKFIKFENISDVMRGLHTHKIDITMNAYSDTDPLLLPYKNETFYDRTLPCVYSRLSVITRLLVDLSPTGINLLLPFPTTFWLLIVFLTFCAAVTLTLTTKLDFRTLTQDDTKLTALSFARTLSSTSFQLFRSILGQDGDVVTLSDSHRFAFIGWELFKFFLLSLYGAVLTSYLTVIAPGPEIHSISQAIDKIVNKNAKLVYWYKGCGNSTDEHNASLNYLKEQIGPSLHHLWEQIDPEKSLLCPVKQFPDVPALVASDSQYLSMQNLDTSKFMHLYYPRLHIIKASLNTPHRRYSLLYRANWPCAKKINDAIISALEADAMDKIVKYYRSKTQHVEEKTKGQYDEITLDSLRQVLLLLQCGFWAATGGLLCEFAYWKGRACGQLFSESASRSTIKVKP